jgi:hypothetical protein
MSRWADLLRLVGDVRRLAFDRTLDDADRARRIREGNPRAPWRVRRPRVMPGCPRCATYFCAGHAPT